MMICSTWEIEDLNKAIQDNPEISAKEIYDIASKYYKERKNQEREYKQNVNDYYDSLIGKYFILDFNRNSKMFFQLEKKEYTGEFSALTYQIYKDNDKKWSVSVERRFINKLWLPNPYVNNRNAVNDVKELSKEEFDNLYNDFKKVEEIHTKLFNII